MSADRQRPFTGRHMLIIMIAFFGVVIAVNVIMARLASSTFGGVVVENSYVASQHFNRWLDEARAENALGWHATATRQGDGRLAVALTGVPAGAVVTGAAWHPLGRQADRPLRFAATSDGRYVSDRAIPAGRWTLRLEVTAGGHRWRSEETVS